MTLHLSKRSPANCVHARPASTLPQLLVAVLAAALTLPVWHPPAAMGWTRIVCPSDCEFARIDSAITHFPSLGPGDVVQVNAGSYAQTVIVANVGGNAASPAIIQTNGQVTIDGSNPLTSWTLCQGNVYYASINIPLPDTTYVDRQVFVGSVRCKFIANAYQNCDTLQQYEYSYDDAADRLYLNAGGGTPQTVYVSSRSAGIDILDGNYIVVDGFTVLRTRARGIRIRGSSTSVRSRSVTVKHCLSAYNFNRGIALENATNCSILNDTTHSNGKHGIYVLATDSSVVAYNESYKNDDPLDAWGGNAGIKIGDSGNTSNVTNVTVDYNAVHDNEDSGIDLHGASNIAVRRNISYRNGDHGYDNLITDGTTFLNNVAARNNHDGISIENGSDNVRVYNCILAYNALEAETLVDDENVAALFVADTTGFRSDHNILVGNAPATLHGSRRRVLVQFLSAACDSIGQYLTVTAGKGFDANSKSSNPLFADSLQGNFVIASASSEAVDRGKADVAGWLSIDRRGFVPHNNDSIPNAGFGTPAFGDIGAYEYDIQPAAITNFQADVVTSTTVHLMWADTGDDGTVGSARDTLRISEDYTAITEASFNAIALADTQPSVRGPGTLRSYTIGNLPICTLYYYGLRAGGGENSLWSAVAVETVITNGV